MFPLDRVNVVGGIAELYVKDAEREDSGIYTLEAVNELGRHSITARVNVLGKVKGQEVIRLFD